MLSTKYLLLALAVSLLNGISKYKAEIKKKK